MEKVVCTFAMKAPLGDRSRGELGVACARYPLPAFSLSPPDSPSPSGGSVFDTGPPEPGMLKTKNLD